MSIIVGLLGAAGVVLFVSGLPLASRGELRRRVAPYVGQRGVRRLGAWPVRFASTPSRLWFESREQITSALICGLAGVMVGIAGDDPASMPFLGLAGLFGGWSAVTLLERNRSAKRAKAIDEGLVTVIDLVVIALSAGETLAGAIARVETAVPGALGDELGCVRADVRSGVPLVEALQRWAMREDLPRVARFVEAIATAIERGAPVIDTLIAQADDYRSEMRRVLIESGGRRELWMLMPVVFLIMPVVVLFALYPGLITLDLLVP